MSAAVSVLSTAHTLIFKFSLKSVKKNQHACYGDDVPVTK